MAFTINESYLSADERCFTVTSENTFILVTVTGNDAAVDRWITATHISREQPYGIQPVGLGVQWNPGGRDPPADTLQLCVGWRCLVFQLSNSLTVPQSLREFLLDPENVFVGLWNDRDRWKLQISRHNLRMLWDPVDMMNYVPGYLWNTPGVPISRDILMSDWSNYADLTPNQVLQVTLDAHFAVFIWRNRRRDTIR
ncbi:hypothetical protein QN277_007412 [Acacia crassicarpa]|uniref:Uncharacterized protein n=1 Tax=Acacia crassicarpa TaxID=499986 RepID=A0AAE1IVW5_9FABA|nr:hypothetical protein QN277_007412 [Acacia crassicarpa]